jgi:hypothetical protein
LLEHACVALPGATPSLVEDLQGKASHDGVPFEALSHRYPHMLG